MVDYSDTEQWAKAIASGDRVALARAITLVESSKEEQMERAAALLNSCARMAVESRRIGITGVPGVGKSTFIDAFGTTLTSIGRKVAVLAVDPSSSISKGSILGDKTRMERLAADPNAFIRPTPAGGALGGVARKTRETITLCEAAGYDTVLVETVGVGQSETAVHDMVDMFVLLVLATAGDELQGIKRGIMEMADLVVINKDDGENASYTQLAKAAYAQALHLFPPKDSGWVVPVVSCSSITQNGPTAVIEPVNAFFSHVTANGYMQMHRSDQDIKWLRTAISEELNHRFFNKPQVKAALARMEEEVRQGRTSPFVAARQLLNSVGYSS